MGRLIPRAPGGAGPRGPRGRPPRTALDPCGPDHDRVEENPRLRPRGGGILLRKPWGKPFGKGHQSHFTRAFNMRVGMTPGQYRVVGGGGLRRDEEDPIVQDETAGQGAS
jgi:hypothetical protein